MQLTCLAGVRMKEGEALVEGSTVGLGLAEQ